MSIDPVAIIALIVASAALALEIRRWFEDRARIKLSVMEDMIIVPDDDGKAKLSLTATNIGVRPTTITHFVVYFYKSRTHRFINRIHQHAIVARQSFEQLPVKLEQADRWTSYAFYTDEMAEYREKNSLSVGVIATHKKNAKLVKVNKKRATKSIPNKKKKQ